MKNNLIALGGEKKPNPPIKVFMVDDTESICLQVSKLFSKEQAEFKYCLAAEQAVAEIEKYQPTVIIQDLYMDSKDGFELLKEYRNNTAIKEIPVLIFSGERDANTKTKLLALGANDFLYKGRHSDQEELVARVLYYAKRFLTAQQTNYSTSLTLKKENYKILVADPSKLSCLITQKILSQEENIVFEYCLDVTGVIDKIESYAPNIIFLKLFDINAWFDLIGKIRNNLLIKNIPLVVYAPFEDVKLQAKSLEAGANEYIVNSADNSELINKISFYYTNNHNNFKNIEKFTYSENIVNINVRLLMVDDSKFICASIEQLLSSEKNIQLYFCNDPLQALELAKQYNPTIVLMDLEMPNITGLELLGIFRKDDFTKEIPVIILSGISDPSVKAKSFALGANDYMEKEMDKIELISRIQYHSRSYINSIQLNNTIQELTDMQKLLKSQSMFIRKTFGRYLSDEIVNSILESPEGMKLGGENRTISIMMTDLRGFTALSESLPAEAVLSIINNYLAVMTELLHKYHGTIDEFIGDAILAIFGAPIARDNDVLRAVACAIEMQLAMQRVNQWNREHHYPDVAMGIGLNTGDAVVGNIGSEKRAKYGIVGHNVNLTSRIESYTTGGQIFISESTLKQCGGILRIDGQMEVSPKGVKAPMTIYEVGGIYGDFNLFLPEKKTELFVSLAQPVSILFMLLDGKNISDKTYVAKLVSLSKQGEEIKAEIKSNFIVECLSNLKICLFDADNQQIGDDIYAKAIKQHDDGFIVTFTFIDPKASQFLGF
jgi:adenylate cyclase